MAFEYIASRPRRATPLTRVSVGLLALALSYACSSSNNPTPPGSTGNGTSPDFVSGLPNANGATGNTGPGAATGDPGMADAAGATPEGAPPPTAPGDSNADAERAISEADILQIDGDQLYAMSEYSGLSTIDMSDPTRLELLGRTRTAGTPFEMYLDGDVLIAMFNNFGRYEYDEEAQVTQWVSSSRVQILDVADPANVKKLGNFDIPGNIADSRRVGDVMYVVSNEWNCWRCSDKPSTLVTSLNLANTSEVKEVDQVRFERDPNTWAGNPSIAVTQERVYIGQRYHANWFDDALRKGTIQVVDISDAAGELEEGAAVSISGQVDNRWQMDEHDGVLRVLSQLSQWRDNVPPTLETFKVNSAQDIEPLASLTLKLPRPEILQSVRFDGDRAFAITFERTDPLFTFDLTDPAAPKQVGELEIPGWVYHMEPRGDRLYGIGFEQENEDGGLHVSLFDISDLAAPTMIQRVNFGGDWGSFAEDQDRIHKSFKLLDEHGMMVVPFSGWDREENECWGKYTSGVQLVDFNEDSLTLRGVAPQVGQARRGFIHRDHLFGVGDDAIQTFDITDRDAPKRIATLETARNITTVRVIGDHALRFGQDWWTDRATLDLVPVAEAESPIPGADVDLSDWVKDDREVCGAGVWQHSYWGNVYTNGDYAYISQYTNSSRQTEPGFDEHESTNTVKFLVLDLSDKNKPEIVGDFETTIQQEHSNNDLNSSHEYFSGVVMTNSALLVGRTLTKTTANTSGNGYERESKYSYDVFDIRDGAAPQLTTNFEVPEAIASFGWAYPVIGCGLDYGWGWGGYGPWFGGGQQSSSLISGDLVASNHTEPLDDGSARGRIYLDRLDVSNPEEPKMLEKLNIPGEAIHFDHEAGVIVTLEYDVEVKDESQNTCWQLNEPNTYWHHEANECRHFERKLNVLELKDEVVTPVADLKVDAIDDQDWYMDSLSITKDRIFVRQFHQLSEPNQTSGIGEGFNPFERKNRILALATANLEQAGTTDGGVGWQGQLRARGTRAFASTNGALTVYDASDMAQEPKVTDHDLYGWGCSSLEVRAGKAYCAEGKQGVTILELE